MSDYEVFQEILDVLPDTISNLDSGIYELNTSIDGLTDEKSSIEWGMSVMTSASDWYLDWWSNVYGGTVMTSGDYGVTNVTEWAIVDTSKPSGGWDYVVYSDTDVTSGSPGSYLTEQYNRQIGFPDAYDHIYKTNGLDGTYGIDARKSGLNTGKGLMEDNRDFYSTVLKVYDRVLRDDKN